MEITHSTIFANQILHKVFIVLTTKPMYQLTITQRRITIIWLTQSLWFEIKFSPWTNDLQYNERR
jgi:hypothetical protein